MSNTECNTNILRAVLYKYASMGAYVFPLCWPEWDDSGHVHCGYGHLDDKGQPEQDNIGKAPLLSGGYRNATQTHGGIDDWLLKYPKANWGANWPNQLVLDVDQDNGAYEDLARLVTDIGELPPTLEQLSGGGGKHIIYLLPEGITFRASKVPGYDRIHVKINGYIVVAGSMHKSGREYSISHDSAIAEAPQTLINLFKTKQAGSETNRVDAIKEGSRHVDLISLIGKLRNDNIAEDLVETMAQAANASADAPLSQVEITKMVREYEHQNKVTAILNLNDTANAEYLAHLYGDILRYDHRRARWLKWSGHRWQPDNNGEIYRLAIASARARYQSASNITDLKERERIANWAIGSENRSRLESTISIARNLQPICDSGENWDTNQWLLGVQNGVVDLRTGILRDGKPEDNITLSTSVKFDPEAKCPLWQSTLKGIFQDDNDFIDWLWRCFGYSITGSVKEQDVVIGHGEGGNGKGIVAGSLRKTMGDYAYDAPFSTFEMNYRASIPNDIAALEHKRIVTSSETNDGTRLNEARLKAISHGDPITARYLHAEFFTYEPECKIFLFVNHKPRVKDDSFGFWRGVRLLPFLKRFEGAADDKDLAKKLEAEKSGILAWLVRGCLEWQKRGLSPIPIKVSEATTEYKRESDELTDFIESPEVIKEDGIIVKSSELYKAYTDWAERANLRKSEILSSVNFSKAMKGKHRWEHKNTGNIFHGIGLVKGFVKGFDSNEQKNNVLPAIDSVTREKIEKPSLPFTPSPETEQELADCPTCGHNEWEYTEDGKLRCPCGHIREINGRHNS